MLVVGSTALEQAGVPIGTPKDLDLIGTIGDISKYIKVRNETPLSQIYIDHGKKCILKYKTQPRFVEIEIAYADNTAGILLDLCNKHPNCLFYDEPYKEGSDNQGVFNGENCIHTASANTCLTLKLSHRYLKNSPFFLKTMTDIINLRELGAKVPLCLEQWLKEREKETYNYGHPSLNRSKEEFFNENEGVDYLYEHDDIHKAIAVGTDPAYTYFKGNAKEVMVDKEKWDRLIEGIKLNSVIEESYTLALERCLIPFNFKYSPRHAFLRALEKCCTSIASGWWREYAWENYWRIVGMYSVDYVSKFHNALVQNKVRLKAKGVNHEMQIL